MSSTERVQGLLGYLASPSEGQPWLDVVTIIKCTVMIFVTVTIVFGNLLAIFVRVTHKRLRRQVSSHFIQSLAIADLCIGLFHALQGLLHSLFLTGLPSDAWVKGSIFMAMTVSNVSLYSVLSISIDRYIAIMKPLRYRAIVKSRSCRIIIVCTWIWSAVLMIPCLTPWVSTYYSSQSFTNSINHRENIYYMIILISLVYGPALVIIAFVYIRVMCVARKHVKKERVVRRASTLRRVARGRGRESLSSRTRYLRSTILVAATYYLTFTPRGAYYLYRTLHSEVPWLDFLTLWIYISTSFINCFIYSWGSKRFRKNAWELFCTFKINVCRKKQPTEKEKIYQLSSFSEDLELAAKTVPYNIRFREFKESFRVPQATLENAIRRCSNNDWTGYVYHRNELGVYDTRL